MVFGCAGLVAAHPGSVVVSVTAGRPDPHPLTDWDRACGFAEGDDVMGVRREEDRAALAELEARPRWLDFLESQYGAVASPAEVAQAIDEALHSIGADSIAMPFGLFHPDHVMTAAACREVARRRSNLRWYVYEEPIYRRLVDERNTEGVALGDVSVAPIELARKRAAIERYPTQLKGLGDAWLDAVAPERYWIVETSR